MVRRLPARAALAAALLLATAALAAPARKAVPEGADTALRARIAALLLRRVEFGSLSLIPVRFEGSRLAGPFEDGGRTTYCVTTRMLGRSFGRGERPRAIVRVEGAGEARRLRAQDYDAEVCAGQRTAPFPEFDTPTAGGT